VALIVAGFSSCSKPDPIIGKWEILEFRCAKTGDEEERSYNAFRTVEFFADGNALLEMRQRYNSFTGAWWREGDSLHVTWKDPEELSPSMKVSLEIMGEEDDLLDLTGDLSIPEMKRHAGKIYLCHLETVWRKLPADDGKRRNIKRI
jgi:hypothetical protein